MECRIPSSVFQTDQKLGVGIFLELMNKYRKLTKMHSVEIDQIDKSTQFFIRNLFIRN